MNNENTNESKQEAVSTNTTTTSTTESTNIKVPTMAGHPKYTIPTTPVETNVNYVKPEEFDAIYSKPEDELITMFINQELSKINYVPNKTMVPPEIKKRKYILRIIFAVLVFIYISLIFFHFPSYTYIIGGIILFIVFYTSLTYDFMDYMKKKLKERPDEKISNLVLSTTQNMVEDRSLIILLSGVGLALCASLLLFLNPVILYEKTADGYAVRYYAYGLTNFKTVTIPETHNGKPVTALRGNAFSNMTLLEEVTLPDTIKEIRGQAFKNDTKLRSVKLPANLEYLGGSAFYNCTSLTNVDLPSTLTYLGGKAFYNAKSLRNIVIPKSLSEINGATFYNCTALEEVIIEDGLTSIGGDAFANATKLVKVTIPNTVTEIGGGAFTGTSIEKINLPDGLKEIRGNTFEGCSYLKEVIIPDSVRRIGGHAFYGCHNLNNVSISARSELEEIGSSAFRNCSNLKSITVPPTTTINSKAFKGSPTKVYKYTIYSQDIINFEA